MSGQIALQPQWCLGAAGAKPLLRSIHSATKKLRSMMLLGSRHLTAGSVLLLLSPNASASGGATVEGLLVGLLALGGAFWLAFAFIRPFRRSMLSIPSSPSRLLTFILAAVVLAYAAGSAATGKTWLGAYVVLRATEPDWFWLLVKFEAGVGVVLLIFGFLSPRRSS